MTNHSREDVVRLIAAAQMVMSSPDGEDLGDNPDGKKTSAEMARDRVVAEFLHQNQGQNGKEVSDFLTGHREGDVLSVHLGLATYRMEVAKMRRGKRGEGFTELEERHLSLLGQMIASGEAIIAGCYPASTSGAVEIVDHSYDIVCYRTA